MESPMRGCKSLTARGWYMEVLEIGNEVQLFTKATKGDSGRYIRYRNGKRTMLPGVI
ncbi:hypothetical protein SAMN04488128_108155 [Chitinophaga eiseniae]|uniref:Uncharacterized protein n=2 Tax=Chitinophaga eiseniae TaxID=634771 RepID=A0A1T4U402_9BACT|nr:hypothetical protein SAMN04488128_108155 [Chitinophaga eiseniae]